MRIISSLYTFWEGRVTINILDKIKLNDGCVQELH